VKRGQSVATSCKLVDTAAWLAFAFSLNKRSPHCRPSCLYWANRDSCRAMAYNFIVLASAARLKTKRNRRRRFRWRQFQPLFAAVLLDGETAPLPGRRLPKHDVFALRQQAPAFRLRDTVAISCLLQQFSSMYSAYLRRVHLRRREENRRAVAFCGTERMRLWDARARVLAGRRGGGKATFLCRALHMARGHLLRAGLACAATAPLHGILRASRRGCKSNLRLKKPVLSSLSRTSAYS